MANNKTDCGSCSEHGRIWINGYHGNKALDFPANQGLIAKVAGLSQAGVNLSDCCVPVIRSHADDIYNIIDNPVIPKTSLELTNNLGSATKRVSTITTKTTSIGFKALDLTDSTDGFGNFFAPTTSNAFGLKNIIITQVLSATVTATDTEPFTVNSKISITDTSTGISKVNVITTKIDLNIANASGTAPGTTKETVYPLFGPDLGSSPAFHLGRYTVQITKFPLFQMDFSNNDATQQDEFNLTLLSPLEVSIDSDNLYSLFTCQDECQS